MRYVLLVVFRFNVLELQDVRTSGNFQPLSFMPAFDGEIFVQPQPQLPDVHADGAIFDRTVVDRFAKDCDPDLALIEVLSFSANGMLGKVGKQRGEFRRLLKGGGGQNALDEKPTGVGVKVRKRLLARDVPSFIELRRRHPHISLTIEEDPPANERELSNPFRMSMVTIQQPQIGLRSLNCICASESY
jgi:hypothetical protein